MLTIGKVLRKWLVKKDRQDNGHNRLCLGWRERKTDEPFMVDGFKLDGCKGDGQQSHMAFMWLKWSPRNLKGKCLAPYD